MAIPQTDRFLRITKGPLTEGEVVLTNLSGQEAISRLYTYQLDFVSTKLSLTAKDLVGKPVTVEIARHDKDSKPLASRFINGYFSRFSAGPASLGGYKKKRFREYRAELVPWLWFLTQTARCFVFFPEKEDKSIYDIIDAVFKRAKADLHIDPTVDMSGISELKNRKVKHCVQYRETDFNFLSRILEQYGVYYYHTQKDGEHKLFLSMKKDYPKADEAKITFPTDTGKTKEDHITSWEHAYEFVSGKWTHSDYNLETPTAKMRQDSPKVAVTVPEVAKYEVYDYPGEYLDPGAAKSDARVRQEEEEVSHDTVSATSICRSLMPGHTFQLDSHPDGDAAKSEKKAYLITSIQSHASQPGPVMGSGEVASYSNAFTCVPDSVQFRPARITPKPVVSGIHTAEVVGPKDEEIHTDEYGRVKVAFHWDREDEDRPSDQKPRTKAAQGEKFFCWVRVGQSIAGNKWGFMAIPRIGQEVVVDFLEGDPDRPLIVGSVYNADQMPHYPLPDHKTRITVRTNSSKGGEGFNELTFEDLKEEERLYMQAQKNMDTRVKNDSKERIYGNRHQIIGWEKDGEKGGSQKEMVYQDKHLDVKKNQLEKIEGNYQLCVGNGDAEDGGNLDVVIEKQRTEKIGEGNDRVVEQDERIKVGGTLSETIGMDHQTKVGMNQAVEAGQEIHIKAGMKVIIEAGMQLSLVGPGGFVDIGPAGVTVQGIMVKINSGGAAGTGSGCSPSEPEEAQEAEPAEPEQAWTPDH